MSGFRRLAGLFVARPMSYCFVGNGGICQLMAFGYHLENRILEGMEAVIAANIDMRDDGLTTFS
jgi:hypothetical protein